MRSQTPLTQERLKELLHYDPDTGFFTHTRRTHGFAKAIEPGDRAGTLKPRDGRRVIRVDGVLFFEHRLAWFYVHGEWPKHQIDHVNQIPDDNRLSNLRDVPDRVNKQNKGAPQSNSASGVRGVSWSESRQKWVAQVAVHGKLVFSKRFSAKDDAIAAVIEARKLHHPWS